MHAVEDERLAEVGAFPPCRERPRPQVVVLALEEGWVVAEVASLEGFAVDEHGRVEERGAEEEVPQLLGSADRRDDEVERRKLARHGP